MSIGVKGRNRLLGDYLWWSLFSIEEDGVAGGLSVPVYEENRVLR